MCLSAQIFLKKDTKKSVDTRRHPLTICSEYRIIQQRSSSDERSAAGRSPSSSGSRPESAAEHT